MRDYLYDEEEYPKHRKKIASKKNKQKKADHKHHYNDCNLKYIGEDESGKLYTLYSPAKYCTTCGKLECRWENYTNMATLNMIDIPMFETEMWAKKVEL